MPELCYAIAILEVMYGYDRVLGGRRRPPVRVLVERSGVLLWCHACRTEEAQGCHHKEPAVPQKAQNTRGWQAVEALSVNNADALWEAGAMTHMANFCSTVAPRILRFMLFQSSSLN